MVPDRLAPLSDQAILAMAGRVLHIESAAVSAAAKHLDDNFVAACRTLLDCPGHVVVTGIGKSGHIGAKIASTLASTGTAAFYVHPAEAGHGDLGMITKNDIVLAISHSGETEELITLIPLLKRQGNRIIALTGRVRSTLARESDIHIHALVEKEACPIGLAPTASTTVALALGDAIALTLLEARGFSPEDFARAHPGGSLGKRLLLRIRDIMHTGDKIPQVYEETPLPEALMEMTKKSLGATAVVDQHNHVVGIFTDGNLRRTLDTGESVHSFRMRDIMTRDCVTIHPDKLAAEGLNLMEEKRINVLLACEDKKLIGVLNMHDLLRAGVL